jgi:hypothetical protein
LFFSLACLKHYASTALMAGGAAVYAFYMMPNKADARRKKAKDRMPPAGVLPIIALGAMAYIYAARPLGHVVTKIERPVCHAVTLGHKCKNNAQR